MSNEIRVSAVLITDYSNRALVVRKHGTERYMQPGGKPEAGETPAETAARELAEELGIHVLPSQLRPIGQHRADAANEAGHTVVADCFALMIDSSQTSGAAISPQAEIADARWITPQDELALAPLSAEILLPYAWQD